jgi:hypothetical protein
MGGNPARRHGVGIGVARRFAASLLLAAGVVCFDAALWMPCLQDVSVPAGTTYTGAHLLFVAVGSLYGLASSAGSPGGGLEWWWWLPVANIVFLAAPWLWTAHPRSRSADRIVSALKLVTASCGVWTVGNFVLSQTGLWVEPGVQELISVFPSLAWQLEVGALAWLASMIFVSAALMRRRYDGATLLARWEARPGADALDVQCPTEKWDGLPPNIRALVVDARRLRLELDAMGPIDGWRVRLIGDWLTQLFALDPADVAFLRVRGVWLEQVAIGVAPSAGARGSAADDRLAEILRVDEALHHFVLAVERAPGHAYR